MTYKWSNTLRYENGNRKIKNPQDTVETVLGGIFIPIKAYFKK